jgi:3'-5' exoribonuclease
MKQLFVQDLKPGMSLEEQDFVIKKYKEATTKSGQTYLDLVLGDKTGEIKAKVWQNALPQCETVNQGDVVTIFADVSEYNGAAQLTIGSMAVCQKVDVAAFVPTSRHNIEDQYEQLLATIATFTNPFLKQLMQKLFADTEVEQLVKKGFGAEKAHHAFLGGLLEHVNEMISFAEPVAAAYPEMNRDLLITGVIIHDIGKIVELEIGVAVSRTRTGHLLGHIIQGIDMVREKINEIDGFPPELADRVLHLIASHHGKLEYGSPVKPMIIEAIALHYIDILSSKLNMVRSLAKEHRNDLGVTDYSYLLESRFYFSPDEGQSEKTVDKQPENSYSIDEKAEPIDAQQDDEMNLQIPF